MLPLRDFCDEDLSKRLFLLHCCPTATVVAVVGAIVCIEIVAVVEW